jgi:hypothetical protein
MKRPASAMKRPAASGRQRQEPTGRPMEEAWGILGVQVVNRQTNNKFLVCSQRGLVTWDICPSQLESLDETGFAVLVESFDE